MEEERKSEMIEAFTSAVVEVTGTVSDLELTSREINNRLDVPENTDFSKGKQENTYGTKENPRNIYTRNENLEGDRHPHTGVEFERKTVQTPEGEYIEGVFPKFESLCTAEIPEELYLESDKTQFKECNKQLFEKLEQDPELRNQFTEDQIDQIKEGMRDGSAPEGYVWNHEPEAGRLSLVDAEVHAQTGHTGGRSIWGGGSDNR